MNKRILLGATTIAVMAGMLVTNVTFAANGTSTLAKSKVGHKIVRVAKKPIARTLLGRSKKNGLATSSNPVKKYAPMKHILRKGAPKKSGPKTLVPETTSTVKTSN